ncbi:cation diffusion facilitator family transporter [Aspergillus homomorphus CBS 101889]|uniref:Cation diffusion facilitator family metal ion transporter n=1 Tax=Aspergillus homomorphus (strain CBS 101889) TaxID=1450537 RepID=A0A395I7Q4_ASPHC|nr:cation diffusion facilitator family metal ion transporter [Aspergillus homomorphus CBS 101889]RAL16157.1 cation diffusion facilitator family metal ion transporter [Aspergillus homomorphus CBS 101889]
MALHLTQLQRLTLVICISLCFFVVEISVGFYTRSLALVADAFHYLNDLIGFIVAFAAVKISSKKESPKDLSFGWQRARLLGAFFNGVFLLALGVSIFLQSIERFISPQVVVENPKLILIIGCIGLALNILSATFLHEHDHSHDNISGHTHSDENPEGGVHEVNSCARYSCQVYAYHTGHRHNNLQTPKKGYDLGMLGVLIHVLGDAINNVGVIIAALIIWLTDYASRYYADPAVSMAIALMILGTSIPLVRSAGIILLESVPKGIDVSDVKHDLESLPEISSVHELHVWRLNQEKSLASVHVGVPDLRISEFVKVAKTMNDCFHSYGIHSATVQPELISQEEGAANVAADGHMEFCQVTCGSTCELLTCCG